MYQEEEAKICFRSLSISHFTPLSKEKTEQLWVLFSEGALNWVAQERMRFQDLKEVEGLMSCKVERRVAGAHPHSHGGCMGNVAEGRSCQGRWCHEGDDSILST